MRTLLLAALSLAGCGGTVAEPAHTDSADDVRALIVGSLGDSCVFAGPPPICGSEAIVSDPRVAEWPDAGAWNCYPPQTGAATGVCAFLCNGSAQVALCGQVGGHCAAAPGGQLCEK